MRVSGLTFLALFIVITVFFLPLVSGNNATATSTGAGKHEFTSANYWIKLDPVGDHSIGDVILINGTTNLPVTENLTMLISGVWRSAQKDSEHDSREVIVHNIPIFSEPAIPGGVNRWSINVTDTVQKNLIVDDYDVGVFSSRDDINALTSSSIESRPGIFHLFPSKNETPLAVLQTTTQSLSPIQQTPSKTILTPTTQSSPLPAVLPIIVLLIISVLNFVIKER
jgi:hypothetical protein